MSQTGVKHSASPLKHTEKRSLIIITSKEGFPRQHLREDAASGPHVDGFGVVVGGEEQARGSVPLGDQTFRQVALDGEEERRRDEMDDTAANTLNTVSRLARRALWSWTEMHWG